MSNLKKIALIIIIIITLILVAFLCFGDKYMEKRNARLKEEMSDYTYSQQLDYVIKHNKDIDETLKSDYYFDYDPFLISISGKCKESRQKYCEQYVIWVSRKEISVQDSGGEFIVEDYEIPDKKYEEENDAVSAGLNQAIEDIEILFDSLVEE